MCPLIITNRNAEGTRLEAAQNQNHHRSSHYDVARYYDSPLPDPLEHSEAAAAPSAMGAATASGGTRGIPHGFPLCTMDHNHPESSQLKLGGRSPFGLQHRINMLFRGKEAPSGVGEKSPHPHPFLRI